MMRPARIWEKIKIIGKIPKKEKRYISINALCTDNEKKTIWLNLESNLFNKNNKGGFRFLIKRTSEKTAQDFSFLPITFSTNAMSSNKAIELLNDVFFWSFFSSPEQNIESYNIANKINFIYNLIEQINTAKEQGQKPNFPENIQKQLELKHDDILILNNIKNFMVKLPKKNMNELLSDVNYTLVLGQLRIEEELHNKVATEEINFKKHKKLNDDDFAKHFEDIILLPQLKQDTYINMAIPEIILGQKPTTGGIILIDHGGTGKSLMKAAMKDFFNSLGAEVKERDQGSISSYVNAGPQIIKKWYRGGPANEVTGPEEVDLVEKARDNEVPSLLIIDEAEDFIKEEKEYKQSAVSGSLNTLKRFIQDVDKGGVTGYVITLLIANIDKEHIHEPLQQGAERLTTIYYGPPRDIDTWLDIFKIPFEKLKFNKKHYNESILAELLLYHNKSVSHEKFGVSPRMFMAFCSKYYKMYGEKGQTAKNDKEFFLLITEFAKVKTWEINFIDFLSNLINDVLLKNLNDDSNISNKEHLKDEYYYLLNSCKDENNININYKERQKQRKLDQLKREKAILNGKLKQEFQTIIITLNKSLKDYNNNVEIIFNEKEFITPLRQISTIIADFKKDFIYDPNINERIIPNLNEIFSNLISIINRLSERKKERGDMINFGKQIELLNRLKIFETEDNNVNKNKIITDISTEDINKYTRNK